MSNTPKSLVIREHEELTGLHEYERNDLIEFALEHQRDVQGNYRPVLQQQNGKLIAGNYVGIIQTRKGTVLEILPKVDLVDGAETEETKRVFFNMLRTWRGFKSAAQFSESQISAVRRFNMLEVFVHLFLNNLVRLTQRGLARHYHPVEDNLPCLRGRILFPQHIRENASNHARFYVRYDEFSANRPANRLIHSTIDRLAGTVRQPRNQQLLHQLRIGFSEIPLSTHPQSDWDRHRVDRTIRHYDAVMQWVGLFLFNQGLTTFAGRHVNQALLFPMWEIFEDFVADSLQRYQGSYPVLKQAPRAPLTTLVKDDKKTDVFEMKPDISLMSGNMPESILDTKWKRINGRDGGPKHGVEQADMYQMFAYGKKYKCRKLALVYPKTDQFQDPLQYEFDEELSLTCFPFDVTEPESSVKKIIQQLKN